MTRVGVALAAGLALLAIAIGATLTRSPTTVAWTDSTPLRGPLAQTTHSELACQGGELLPRGTSAVRLSLFAIYGPRLTVRVLSGKRVLTSGVRDAGWTGEIVTVPVQPVRHRAAHVKLCFALGRTDEAISMVGAPASPTTAATAADGQRLPGRMRIEYMAPGPRSWWSLASWVARRMGLGRAAAGTWVVLLVMAAMTAVVAGASWLTVRELR
jgi:hypothetical protein